MPTAPVPAAQPLTSRRRQPAIALAAALAALVAAAAGPLAAQATQPAPGTPASTLAWQVDVAAGIMSARGERDAAGTGTLGGSVRWRRLAFGARAADLAFYATDQDTRFQSGNFGGFEPRCLDSETNRFVSMNKCQAGTRFEYAAAGDVGVAVREGRFPLQLGAGYRVGHASTPYGFARLGFRGLDQPRVYLDALVGSRFFQASVGFALPDPLSRIR